MTKNSEIYFIRIISVTLYAFAFVIIPALMGFSFLLRRKIDEAFEKYGRDETIKLINIMGVFGLVRILFSRKSKT